MSGLTIISAVLAVAGLAFLAAGIRRIFQRKFLRAAGLELSGALLLALASSALLLASNLYTYQRLTYEQPVAEVSFRQLSPQQYEVEVRSLDSDLRYQLVLKGDEWQLDAQVLTWQGLASLFGLDASYRLHRIAGRFSDIADEQKKPRSVYSLVGESPVPGGEKFDLWQFASKHRDWVRWVDAAYGSAVFLPMADGAKFQVAISRTGLIARPDNEVARKAVSHWIGL